MSLYSVYRNAYCTCVPESVRDRIYRITPGPMKRFRKRLIGLLERTAAHDEIYNVGYYEKFVEPTMRISARAISGSIVREFEPRTVVDVGCGTGVLLCELGAAGVDGSGLELADAALATCRGRGLRVYKCDIERDPTPKLTSDVVVSTEVAEHLPASCADAFVDLLVGIAPVIVLTAATPSQGGTDHVNEQPNEYWIEKLSNRGFRFDESRSHRWRSEWKHSGVAACFWSSLMVFSNQEAPVD